MQNLFYSKLSNLNYIKIGNNICIQIFILILPNHKSNINKKNKQNKLQYRIPQETCPVIFVFS